jgi:hypothetical protein
MNGYFRKNGEFIAVNDPMDSLSKEVDVNEELREEVRELKEMLRANPCNGCEFILGNAEKDEQIEYLTKEVAMLKAEVQALHETHADDMRDKAELNAALYDGTKYAVVVTDEKGQKKVITKRLDDGTPFCTSPAAALYIGELVKAFPNYEFDWAPVRGVMQ